MCTPERPRAHRRERGLTLIELVLFIVIVGIAVVGIMQAISTTTKSSADPQLRKQALAVAEALLEEAQLMPFTDCDPDGYDNSVTPATCTQQEQIGPETDEVRGGATPLDNVNDYHGFVLAGGGTDLGNSTDVTVPAGYDAAVTVAEDGAFAPGVPAADALRITVTVNYSGGTVIVEGYRARYAPKPQL